MRLIDADALKDRIDSAFTTYGECTYVKGIIDAQPTIEAEPVRYGYWKQRRNGEYYCSNCGREEKYIFQKNYCPMCGSKMHFRSPTEAQLDESDSVIMGDSDNEI